MKTLITRADDFASNHAANKAIAKAADAGFVKNISVMAVCGHVDEAAELLAGREDLCFGLHITLNSEWDKVRWGPLTAAPSLRDGQGFFPQDPAVFASGTPSLDEAMEEIEAQYNLLTKAGFKISYAEAHMLPERFFSGLQKGIHAWAEEKGLLDFCCYIDNVIPHMDRISSVPGLFDKVLRGLEEGQYLYVTHPALYGAEMLQTGNAGDSAERIASHRNADAEFLAAPDTLETCLAHGFTPIRLDEAVPGPYRVLYPGPIL